MSGLLPAAAVCAAGLAGWLLLGPATPGAARERGRRAAPGRRLRARWRSGPGAETAEPAGVVVARAAAEVAALLRAGAPPVAAWAPQRWDPGAGPAPLGGVLDRAARAAFRGDDLAAELRSGARPPRAAAALDALALAWRTSETTGAPAAAVLDRLVTSLLDDAGAQDARDAALAGPRATARLLAVLPLAGVVLGVLVGADPVGVLLGTVPGRWCAAVGVLATVLGWVWTALLVRAAERAR
ncbi:type II secretion system F family protein [Quadrisphaera sp. INWT6]|uniref:type II secretion system F family protein n=1 Tax=Quadrisphaera sp. INWT6 TaxID=2596917 RepID=UPI001891F974|nr:type II secretion system F family protein [Quadrisphaera sp. INWT6]